ncbi:hypothetical protein PIB30_051402 [Stylosanthes scabra]|uniref:Uncharacterized protein n=1 Tax=Stylosanthes scabra TaxID=79078 RepID=A0ABU6VH43_9FABA|nr:hypothetical protein [Stylosanthes scabra]
MGRGYPIIRPDQNKTDLFGFIPDRHSQNQACRPPRCCSSPPQVPRLLLFLTGAESSRCFVFTQPSPGSTPHTQPRNTPTHPYFLSSSTTTEPWPPLTTAPPLSRVSHPPPPFSPPLLSTSSQVLKWSFKMVRSCVNEDTMVGSCWNPSSDTSIQDDIMVEIFFL